MPKTSRASGPEPAPSPPTRAALACVALVTAACLVVSASFRIYDTDVWQHLAVGRAIWTLHRVPTTQLWTWPTYGEPDVNASWGFRALIWPLWQSAGVWGLFAWRWASTLLAFGFAWAAARRMGARGLVPFLALAWCGLVYRQRSQVRPETLVSVLLAIQIWILERRRVAPGSSPAPGAATSGGAAPRVAAAGTAPRIGGSGRDWTLALPLVAWAWANAHISYYVGFVVLGIHLLGTAPIASPVRGTPRAEAWAGSLRLAVVTLAAVAISFLNPWGWRALWQPFEYFLYWRHEPIFRTIGELTPVGLLNNVTNGLWVMLLAWPALVVWRARRVGLDRVEALTCVFFTVLATGTQRFLGTYAIAAAPYLARDLGELWNALPIGRRHHASWARALAASAACVALCLPEWSRRDLPIAVAFDYGQYPVKACDFIETHGIRGRGFNQFAAGGYMVYRFWPDRSRLPFMDIHQAGTPRDRTLYVYALANPPYWNELDGERHFDYALTFHRELEKQTLNSQLDADPTWVRVFMDDAAVLYVRRNAAHAAVIASDGYARLPGGQSGLEPLGEACARDTAVRRETRAELERVIRESPWHSRAASLLANIALMDDGWDEAQALLEDALRVDPDTPRAWERLGLIELARGNARAALEPLARARRLQGKSVALALTTGAAWHALGDRARAAAAYREALALAPGGPAADSLRALGEAR
ncbi:MAG TPA: tetratricopeptide repeat protein [Candidatus Saccharimonadaceae bacterium]|nr:tetratricopeptide repeat protein [Candidatus Saccharimonadaceae bacterium]